VRVRFLEPARDDLQEAVAYYEARRTGLGREFRQEVRAAVARIRRFPTGWQPLSEHTRRCLTRRFPYGLIYHVGEDEILIVAVAHLHREPGHWRERLPS
jgi:plasmid stabilization system protein ParE